MFSRHEAASSSDPEFLTGGGEMRALMRAHDWQSTSLGDPETWPQALRSAVQICLNTPIVGAVLWGTDLSTLYNDVYAPALAERHPWALGRPFSEVWAEIWDVLGPQIASVVETGRGFSTEHQLLKMERNGRTENTYWIYSFAPLYDGGLVAGILVTAVDTTERVKADQNFTRLFQASPAPFLVLRPDTPTFTIAEVNDAYLAATMRTREDLVGRGVFAAFPDNPDDKTIEGVSLLRSSLERVLATHEPDTLPDLKYDLARPDGTFEERRWSPVNSAVIDEHGEVSAIIHNAIDVTVDRRMQAALRDSEERLRLAVDNAEVGFWDVDLIHDELIWPPHTKAMFGISPDMPVTVADFYDGLHPDDREATSEAFAAAVDPARRVLYDVEYRTVGKEDGIVRWVAAKGRGMFDETGRCLRATGTAIDVTARRVADERLRASEAVARENVERVQLALAAGAIVGTWHWDIPTDRFTVDDAFANAFGLDPALGREGIPLAQIVETVHPDDQAGLSEAIDEAVARGGAYAYQYRVRRTDGRYYWIEANGRVDHHPDGTPLSFPGVVVDVEEKRAVEAERDRASAALRALNDTLEQRVAERSDELLKAEEQLRQSQKVEAVGQLTGGVAHDFNNLLTVIRGSIDLLRRPDVPEERRRRYLDAIADTADRATKLTSQLLAFARRQALKPEIFDVSESVRNIEDMVRTLTGSRVAVVSNTAHCPCFVDADRSQFDTAIVNMAVNARDAMSGEGKLTVSVGHSDGMPAVRSHPHVPGTFVTIALTDTGSGIAPDQIDRIFEPFFTTKGVGEGTGLGLSQVFGFAKQSGGDVLVESELGQGSTFTLYLPRASAPDSSIDIVRHQDVGGLGEGACVLVVEDNPEVGTFAVQALNELGYKTVLANDGAAALAELGSCVDGFDVVFSDVMMPGISGIELAKEIGRLYPQVPVVLTSGYSDVLAETGTHGFELLQKPYSIEELSRVLRNVSDIRGVSERITS